MVASLAFVCVFAWLWRSWKAQDGCFLVGMGTETKHTSVRERQPRQELKRRPETLPSCLYIKKIIIECAEKNVHGRALDVHRLSRSLKPTTNEENGVVQGYSAILSRGKPQFLEIDEHFCQRNTWPPNRTRHCPRIHTRCRSVTAQAIQSPLEINTQDFYF